MQFNLIIVLFALAALALDNLTIFDDKPERYENAPVDISSPVTQLMDRESAQSQSLNEQTVTVSEETNSAAHFEQTVFPTRHQVALGSVVVPVDM